MLSRVTSSAIRTDKGGTHSILTAGLTGTEQWCKDGGGNKQESWLAADTQEAGVLICTSCASPKT